MEEVAAVAQLVGVGDGFAGVSGAVDDGEVGGDFFEPLGEFDAAHDGHSYIGEDEFEFVFASAIEKFLEGVGSVDGFDDFVAEGCEGADSEFACHFFVFGEEDGAAAMPGVLVEFGK